MNRALGLLLLLTPISPVLACSPPSLNAVRNASDAVVWGVFDLGADRGEGTVTISRREKGRLPKIILIRWDTDAIDDGVNCPEWRPQWKHERGRFYLRRNDDSTYAVLMADTRKKARN